jgi:hypothetical protein
MTNTPRTAITPTRESNYAEWYQQVYSIGPNGVDERTGGDDISAEVK